MHWQGKFYIIQTLKTEDQWVQRLLQVSLTDKSFQFPCSTYSHKYKMTQIHLNKGFKEMRLSDESLTFI